MAALTKRAAPPRKKRFQRSKKKFLWTFFGLLAIAAAATGGYWIWTQKFASSPAPTIPNTNPPPENPGAAAVIGVPEPSRGPQGDSPEPAPPDRPKPSDPPHGNLPGEARAKASLEAFFAADTWQEKLKYCLNADRIAQKLKAYYEDTPLVFTPTGIKLQFSEEIPNTSLHSHAFLVSSEKHPDGITVALEDTADGPKLNWEAFVEFQDDTLGAFLGAFKPDPGIFHVYLERAHYFRTDVPDIGNLYCFRIRNPIPGNESFAFLPKSGKMADEIARKFDWDSVYFPVAELQWVRHQESEYVQINRIVRENWRE